MSKKYVDGFIMPIPKKNLKAYIKMATLCSKVWVEHGAIDYFECSADDVEKGKFTSFPRSVKLKKNETVIFAFITYKTKKHRDAVMKKVFADPRLAFMMDEDNMLFDGMRMIYGGFKTVVQRSKK